MNKNMQKYLGLRVKTLREKAHLTQEELSVACDVSWRTISNLERGRVMPELALILKISAYFKIPLEDLLNVNIAEHKSLFRIEKELIVIEKIKSVNDSTLNYISEQIDLILKHFQ